MAAQFLVAGAARRAGEWGCSFADCACGGGGGGWGSEVEEGGLSREKAGGIVHDAIDGWESAIESHCCVGMFVG